jgi:hypothetical protein
MDQQNQNQSDPWGLQQQPQQPQQPQQQQQQQQQQQPQQQQQQQPPQPQQPYGTPAPYQPYGAPPPPPSPYGAPPRPPYGYGLDTSVMTTKQWVVTLLIMMVPCVNLIMLFVWAFGSQGNANRKYYAQAYLIFIGILIAVYIVLMIIFAALGLALFDYLLYW